MTKYLTILILFFCACNNDSKPTVDKITHYDTRDYVTVGQKMDSLFGDPSVKIRNSIRNERFCRNLQGVSEKKASFYCFYQAFTFLYDHKFIYKNQL
jgi:hypothetical protein